MDIRYSFLRLHLRHTRHLSATTCPFCQTYIDYHWALYWRNSLWHYYMEMYCNYIQMETLPPSPSRPKHIDTSHNYNIWKKIIQLNMHTIQYIIYDILPDNCGYIVTTNTLFGITVVNIPPMLVVVLRKQYYWRYQWYNTFRQFTIKHSLKTIHYIQKQNSLW